MTSDGAHPGLLHHARPAEGETLVPGLSGRLSVLGAPGWQSGLRALSSWCRRGIKLGLSPRER